VHLSWNHDVPDYHIGRGTERSTATRPLCRVCSSLSGRYRVGVVAWKHRRRYHRDRRLLPVLPRLCRTARRTELSSRDWSGQTRDTAPQPR